MSSYAKNKGRSNKSPPFIKLDHKMLEHPNYLKLTPHGIKLLLDLLYQYRGKNNGDLCSAYSVLKKRGWRSSGTLQRAINELLYYEFIIETRRGGRNCPNLYALSWHSIDECKGKLDVATTRSGRLDWMSEKKLFNHKKVKPKIGFCTPYVNQPAPYVNLSVVK
jgi:hypothetical protein